MALRQSCARSWSTSRSRVLSDWTISGPSDMGRLGLHGRLAALGLLDLALPGAVGGDVGPRRAAVGAVAPRLVGGGVHEDVGAAAGVADPEPGGAQVADQRREPHERLRDQQLGDRRVPVGHVHVPAAGLVPGDVRRDRVLGQQRVEQVHDRVLVAVVGGLEHRAELLDEAAQRPGVPIRDLRVQPLPLVEEVDQVLGVGQVGVHQPRRPLRVTNKVHLYILRSTPTGRSGPRRFKWTVTVSDHSGGVGLVPTRSGAISDGLVRPIAGDRRVRGGGREGPRGLQVATYAAVGAYLGVLLLAPDLFVPWFRDTVLGNLGFLAAFVLLVHRAAAVPTTRFWTLPLATGTRDRKSTRLNSSHRS